MAMRLASSHGCSARSNRAKPLGEFERFCMGTLRSCQALQRSRLARTRAASAVMRALVAAVVRPAVAVSTALRSVIATRSVALLLSLAAIGATGIASLWRAFPLGPRSLGHGGRVKVAPVRIALMLTRLLLVTVPVAVLKAAQLRRRSAQGAPWAAIVRACIPTSAVCVVVKPSEKENGLLHTQGDIHTELWLPNHRRWRHGHRGWIHGLSVVGRRCIHRRWGADTELKAHGRAIRIGQAGGARRSEHGKHGKDESVAHWVARVCLAGLHRDVQFVGSCFGQMSRFPVSLLFLLRSVSAPFDLGQALFLHCVCPAQRGSGSLRNDRNWALPGTPLNAHTAFSM